jgi:hypothetical protein
VQGLLDWYIQITIYYTWKYTIWNAKKGSNREEQGEEHGAAGRGARRGKKPVKNP